MIRRAILIFIAALPLMAAPPRFEHDVLPLLKARCGACHGAKSRQAGLSIETREDLIHGGKTGAAIVPGKSQESLLLSIVSNGRMPLSGPKLTGAEIDLLRAWIDGGALREQEAAPPIAVSDKEVFSVILGAKCFVCHGRRTQMAGLDLRTLDGLLRGGKSGPAMVPGKPEESLIVKRIAAQEMPPPKLQERYSVRGLTSDEFDKLKAWIASGAPQAGEQPLTVDPATDAMVKPKDRSFWSFQTPVLPTTPAVRSSGLVRNPIDAFLLAKLEAKGLSFSPEASRLTLMRRAYLDLVGYPPTPEEIKVYEADRDPKAYEHLVDRLLESPHYGERWARFWLDAAGYADSEGGVSSDTIRPDAWRYRDYVIKAMNSDKPYNQFLVEQIAGDELFDYKAAKEYSPDQIEKLVATGFMRMGPDPTYSTEQNFIPERLDTLATHIEILGSSVMGLTVGCARCHDHKYDPIPQRDYYRLSAIFRPAYDPWDWRVPNVECVGVGADCKFPDTRLLPLKSAGEVKRIENHNQPIEETIARLQARLKELTAPFQERIRREKLAKLPADVRADLSVAIQAKAADRTEIQKYLLDKFDDQINVTNEEIRKRFPEFGDEADTLNKQIAAEKKKLKQKPMIRATFDMGGAPTPVRVLLRGEFTNPGALVEPGPLSVIGTNLEPYRVQQPDFTSQTSGRRLAFAKWLTQPGHPLTARVIVNRVWQDHFGFGIVRSPANFGHTGMAPTHPELLDYLAVTFVRNGWSLKSLHRAIMTSSAYRQSSQADAARVAGDSDNSLLSRFPLRRMDADTLRDSLLRVASRLDFTAGGPPVEITKKDDGEIVTKPGLAGERRTIYLLQRRTQMLTMLNVFDAPMLSPNCIRRGQSTVASQALNLTNSELAQSSARYLAGRIIDAAGADTSERVRWMFLSIYGRAPKADEATSVTNTLRNLTDAWKRKLQETKPQEPVAQKADWMALATVCHTLFNSAEFIYID